MDFVLCSFDQGLKWWKHKNQLSDILSVYTLDKCIPYIALQTKT
jgi:hypothetical protein